MADLFPLNGDFVCWRILPCAPMRCSHRKRSKTLWFFVLKVDPRFFIILGTASGLRVGSASLACFSGYQCQETNNRNPYGTAKAGLRQKRNSAWVAGNCSTFVSVRNSKCAELFDNDIVQVIVGIDVEMLAVRRRSMACEARQGGCCRRGDRLLGIQLPCYPYRGRGVDEEEARHFVGKIEKKRPVHCPRR